MKTWTGKWGLRNAAGGLVEEYGRTFVGSDGRPRYQLRKMVQSVMYEFNLDVSSEKEAVAERALFLRDPAGYRTKTQAQADRVYLSADTIGAFLKHLKEKGRVAPYIDYTYKCLLGWSEALGPTTDLASLNPKTVKKALGRWDTGVQKRIAALKSFCSFLVDRGDLDPNENPSRMLKVPKSTPEIATREKCYTVQQLEATYRAMDDQLCRDVMCLRVKTGLHGTEIDQLLDGRATLERLPPEFGEIVAVLSVRHKDRNKKMPHRVALDAQGLAAAERLMTAGVTPYEHHHKRLHKVFQAAGERAGVEDMNPSTCRHTFITLAGEVGRVVTPKDRGAPMSVIQAVVGHAPGTSTTQLHYDQAKRVPEMIVLPVNLTHPADPPLAPTKLRAVS